MPCPLWQGAHLLAPVLESLRSELGPADRHAATMTAELVDVFPNRREGVPAVAAILARALPAGKLRLYAGRHGFVAPEAAASLGEDIASANWHASAALAARYGDGLFVDIGSTTTDIVPLLNGAVHARATTDGDRLVCGELVYTGMTRSYIMALGSRAPVRRRLDRDRQRVFRLRPPMCIASSARWRKMPTRWKRRTAGRRPWKPPAPVSPA